MQSQFTSTKWFKTLIEPKLIFVKPEEIKRYFGGRNNIGTLDDQNDNSKRTFDDIKRFKTNEFRIVCFQIVKDLIKFSFFSMLILLCRLSWNIMHFWAKKEILNKQSIYFYYVRL